jgi:hypothetical protein
MTKTVRPCSAFLVRSLRFVWHLVLEELEFAVIVGESYFDA